MCVDDISLITAIALKKSNKKNIPQERGRAAESNNIMPEDMFYFCPLNSRMGRLFVVLFVALLMLGSYCCALFFCREMIRFYSASTSTSHYSLGLIHINIHPYIHTYICFDINFAA